MDIFEILSEANAERVSDVHLVAASPPLFRVDGLLKRTNGAALGSDDIEVALNQLTSDRQQAEFKEHLELDFGYTVPEVGRIRCNAAKERGAVTMVIRMLPHGIPDVEQLGLPQVCKELVMKRRGLVIVSGPTGSGKSTTLAAMLNYLNRVESRRVVTVEDPIEYVYSNVNCAITQRELGTDTVSFAAALRHVLRQNPDVILVGEVRDTETAAAALGIAETGHLVLTTGHAPSASQAVERIVDLFPPHERPLAQSQLSSLILGIFCQALIPKVDGSGRVAAVEVMLGTAAVRNLIREGKIHQLPNTIRMQSQEGMEIMDQALVRLYRTGIISKDSVFSFCNDRDEVTRLL